MQKNTQYKWCFLAILAASGVASEASWAAPITSSADTEQPLSEPISKNSGKPVDSQKNNGTEKKQPAQQRPADKTPDFKPSEKISEDFSVSFPVDI